MTSQADVVVRNKRRVFDGFFKLDELTLSHRLFSGDMSPDKKVLVLERGDAVAALIYNRTDNRVVLVEQFKAPTMDTSPSNGWITEVMAGIIRDGEEPEQALAREALEETGYRITEPEHIITFYSSPGGSSERIFLYYAVVDSADKVGPGGGVAREGEDIRTVTLAPEVLFDKLRQGLLEDPKVIIAAHHLKERLRLKPGKASVLRSRSGPVYALKGAPHLTLALREGQILDVRGIDVWVNPENTDMMMDRVIGKTISANIRFGGAERDENGNIVEDTVADALRAALGSRRHVRPGEVVETQAGGLAEFGVRRILHVAAAVGHGPGRGVSADAATVSICVARVLQHVHAGNSGFRLFRRKDTSVLLPMIGTGDGGLKLEHAAPLMVDQIKEFYRSNPATDLRRVELLAYTNEHKAACEEAIAADGAFELLPDTANT